MNCHRCSTPETCRTKGCQGSSVNAATKPNMNAGRIMNVKSATKKTTQKLK